MKGRILLLTITGLLVVASGTVSFDVTEESIAESRSAARSLSQISLAPKKDRIAELKKKAVRPRKVEEKRNPRSIRHGTPHLRASAVGHAHPHSHPHIDIADAPVLALVDYDDIRAEHQHLVTETLNTVFPRCINNLRNLYIRYGETSTRGLAGAHTIMVNASRAEAEVRALLIHEYAHTMHLGCLAGDPLSGASEFQDGSTILFQNNAFLEFMRISWSDEHTQKAHTMPSDFVSGYAASDTFEDIAETFLYYITQYDAFALRAEYNLALREKLRIMHELFPHLAGNAVATGSSWNGEIPWDVTKLSYQWHPGG